MKTLLIDRIPQSQNKLTIKEGLSSSGRMLLVGKLQEAETQNGNGRIYPLDILEREINKYIEGPIRENCSTGELDHPESSVINLSNLSHVIKNIWWDGNSVMGELEILNTPSGRIAQEIISAGIPLGISSRGMGSVKQIGENVEVQNDFDLLCWDLVSTPSTPGAYMSIKEGIEHTTPYNNRINQIITEIICEETGICSIIK
jgi:hypothetical protein